MILTGKSLIAKGCGVSKENTGWFTGSLVHRPDGCAKRMSLNKGETAVHGCQPSE